MHYQWGRKDPFTFATSSEVSGSAASEQYGKYSVKMYTIDGVLLYQETNGSGNTNKQPVGGIIFLSTPATSMMETVKNPITFYGGLLVINQVGHTRSLWDYYWTSYSRGADDAYNSLNWHNIYLDVYNSQRFKSIYDPCPFGFRMPSNGTYKDFKVYGWYSNSYLGGVKWSCGENSSFISALGYRQHTYFNIGRWGIRICSTLSSSQESYTTAFNMLSSNNSPVRSWAFYYGHSVRCIENLSIRPMSFLM